MRANKFPLANQVVKEQYKELMNAGLPFLQIFPEMIQEADIAETFKRRGTLRNKSILQSELDTRSKSVEEFRENLFNCFCALRLVAKELYNSINLILSTAFHVLLLLRNKKLKNNRCQCNKNTLDTFPVHSSL